MWIISQLNKPPHDFHSWVTFDVTSKAVFKFRWRTFSTIWFQFPFKFNLDESLVNRGFIVSSCQALLSSLWLKFNSILAGHFLTKQSYMFLLLLLLLFVFRIPFPKRPSSPQSQPSLGWSSLRTSSTGTLRLLPWQTGSNTGFCQSRELLRPSLCSRGSGCLGWRHHGEQFHSVCHTGW